MGVVGDRSELTAQGAIEIVVRDIAPVLRFYRDLGFVVERETPDFVSLRWDRAYLFLARNDGATTAPRWANVRILVNDVDSVWHRAQELRLHTVRTIADRPYGLRDFTLRDPAGFEIRFAQVLGPR